MVFAVVVTLFATGVSGFALGLAGGLVTALSWTPFAFPDFVTGIDFLGSEISHPAIAALLLLSVGLVLLGVGGSLLAATFYIGKAAMKVDRELSQAVDKSVPGIRELTAAKGDRISRLERLAALHEKGILSKEEFEREKARVLEEPDNS